MKKRNIFFFLALLCLFGKDLYGQKVAGHPPVPSAVEGAPVVVYGEIKSRKALSQFEVKYWENPLDLQNDAPVSVLEYITLLPGKLSDGTLGNYTFRWDGNLSYPTVISISSLETDLLNQFVLFPGDSIKVYLDTHTHVRVFSGPSEASFQYQEDRKRMNKKNIFSKPVSFLIRNPSSLFDDEEQLKAHQNQQLHGFGREVDIQEPDAMSMFLKFKEEWDSFKTHQLADLPEYGHIKDRHLKYLLAHDLAESYNTDLQSLARTKDYAIQEGNDQLSREIDQLAIDKFLPLLTTYDDPSHHSPYVKALFTLLTQFSTFKIGEGLDDLALTANLKDQLLMMDIFWKYRQGRIPYYDLAEMAKKIRHPETKKITEDFLVKFRPGTEVTGFNFQTPEGDSLKLDDLRGHYVLVSTYFTGCSASSNYYKRTLDTLLDTFKTTPDLKVVIISSDTDDQVWHHSLSSKQYTDHRAINLWAGTPNHPFLRFYHLKGYPSQVLLGPDGEIIAIPGLKIGTKGLISTIQKHLNSQSKP
ncbi:TlpA family protein disulfide reductase [Anditalea andensis]|uniref:Thioredoxin domain-containing protein n=1 Tax=Anditalea andensis TaxID=1048983 RepID=A0A074KS45_9BACT|nr:thioredoxin-like domain-containing protein [Anditalea andensis]KEO71714.1 hypothetical protein EL17_23220 [Anditalea andensis]